jgi:hypothetical protein
MLRREITPELSLCDSGIARDLNSISIYRAAEALFVKRSSLAVVDYKRHCTTSIVLHLPRGCCDVFLPVQVTVDGVCSS